MTEDLNITLRPSSGPYKSPKQIVKFYDNFEGWQEALPKTDNTYSPGSKYYKYEVSPGIPFIPNMSRLPLKSYEKTPLKDDCSDDQLKYLYTSSHIKRQLFTTSTTYTTYNKLNNHNEIQTEIEERFSTTRRKTTQVINYVSQSVQIFIKYIISYCISISTLTTFTEIYKSVMDIGSNTMNTIIRKIKNWVHLASIKVAHYDLIVMTTIRRIFHYCFGHNSRNRLITFFLLVLPFLTVCIIIYMLSELLSMWQDSWTNFLISPFINILNLITSICQIISSTMYFVLELITVPLASSIVYFRLFGQTLLNVLRNINTVVDSATKVNTAYIDKNTGISPFDYNMLAKQVLASEEFQRMLINQLNISQSDRVKLHDQEFQQLFRNQLQEINSENLNWINNQLNEQQIKLQNVNKEMSGKEKETIQLMEKKIMDLQNIVLSLTNNFETYKSKSETLNSRTDSMTKDACVKDDWNSIVNYIEQYVNMTMKSTLNIYDADKTGMVDYALESAGATVIGTRCTQTKPSTAALTLFGLPLWFISNGPRLAIQPGVNPGQCWAFIGAKGFLVLKLSKTIHITGVTIEHLPKSLSEDGHIRSAPKDFSIWGLKHETDADGKLLGKYQFTVDGPSLQYFPIEGKENIFSIVELRIESNHGHDEYTCLYRIRVHGDLV